VYSVWLGEQIVPDERRSWNESSQVLFTGIRQTTSPIWLHWHQLRRADHIFTLPTASPLTSLGHGRGWVIVHSRSLVRAPGTHFLLTFVVQPAWTLLTSVSS